MASEAEREIQSDDVSIEEMTSQEREMFDKISFVTVLWLHVYGTWLHLVSCSGLSKLQ